MRAGQGDREQDGRGHTQERQWDGWDVLAGKVSMA